MNVKNSNSKYLNRYSFFSVACTLIFASFDESGATRHAFRKIERGFTFSIIQRNLITYILHICPLELFFMNLDIYNLDGNVFFLSLRRVIFTSQIALTLSIIALERV